jgi:GH15 family glucan-1,4-alpha-glucosidase
MKNAAKIAIISLVLAACQNVNKFPDIPYVRLESYELVAANVDPDVPGEHIVVKFYFTDGDGNIGLNDNQLDPPHCETCGHYYNLFVNVNSKVDGAFEKTYDYNSRIKDLTPNAQYQVLEGHMIYKIDIANRASDTIMIDFYLEDRDINKSNVDMTPEVFVNL